MNSVLIKNSSKFDLTNFDYDDLKEKIINTLTGRVDEAYLFGSFADKSYNKDSDIDIILIKETDVKFIKRPFEFIDLLDIYPDIDILVYTKKELKNYLNDSEIGMWKSVKETMVQII